MGWAWGPPLTWAQPGVAALSCHPQLAPKVLMGLVPRAARPGPGRRHEGRASSAAGQTDPKGAPRTLVTPPWGCPGPLSPLLLRALGFLASPSPAEERTWKPLLRPGQRQRTGLGLAAPEGAERRAGPCVELGAVAQWALAEQALPCGVCSARGPAPEAPSGRGAGISLGGS